MLELLAARAFPHRLLLLHRLPDRNNSMPMAKIFRINAAKGKYEPVSDAIEIK